MRPAQRGMTIWMLMVTVALVAFAALLVMRCVPVYLNQMKVSGAVERVAKDPENPAASVRTMRSALERYWTIERIRHLDPEDVDLVRGDGETRYLEYQYEARVPLIHNIDLLFTFEEQVMVGRGS
ncbi:DUF4845 domain-containing protein [Algiphilus sp.]|uniref:DUF4845 domain-containing protein n=1 Tax=Algiphilus sp. TaxID=1872431 RepID=UPI001CA78BF1|nr:DUF4845 domain-containing protein [Algiphilus sp.]MBY8966902.1 DUF4845 domain-containing protein [Algiphilus acroporae]MCI5062189.1 DUF4845 domain-containing protein [Algiphilus sp.]MCI5103600.1 DUF4845 domain-containing protein [Algiphilus sp.]MCR9091591.1 DUF4845 domain-containing protein [Pseudomonadota bacterium]